MGPLIGPLKSIRWSVQRGSTVLRTFGTEEIVPLGNLIKCQLIMLGAKPVICCPTPHEESNQGHMVVPCEGSAGTAWQ